jgi:hypothetical protein
MAKNYASLYSSALDSSALNQTLYVKQETVNGTMIAPTDSDFTFILEGGSMNFSQPLESSLHRSGRHNNNTILKKKTLEWSYPTYINIDTGVAAGASEIEDGIKTLWRSALGRETIDVTGCAYDSANDPSTTFTIFEVGDMWCKQGYGCFVDSAEIQFVGDGESQINWSGMGVESYLVGMSQSIIDNNGGNTVTVAAGEGKRFPVGSMVMLVESDGVTRSADTPNGSPRIVTDVTGDVVTLDGAVLADADGSVTPVYLVYYEPEAPVGIDNPQVGLVGDFISASMGGQCVRNATISIANNHEPVNYCFGTDALDGSIFVPASRLEVTASVEINMSKANVGIYNDIQNQIAQDLQFILGDSTTRHLQVTLPRVEFTTPSIDVPSSGSIPVTFEGVAYQTSLDAADEIEVKYL